MRRRVCAESGVLAEGEAQGRRRASDQADVAIGGVQREAQRAVGAGGPPLGGAKRAAQALRSLVVRAAAAMRGSGASSPSPARAAMAG